MNDRQDIVSAIARMPSTFGAKRELKALPGELEDGENVDIITSGMYKDGVGILVATDRRLLFLYKGLIRAASEDFRYSRISSVEYKGGIALASIKVYVSNQEAEIKNLTKTEAKSIVDITRERMHTHMQSVPPVLAAPTVVDQLLKLKQLHEAGVLTDEQYEEKSAPLIGEL